MVREAQSGWKNWSKVKLHQVLKLLQVARTFSRLFVRARTITSTIFLFSRFHAFTTRIMAFCMRYWHLQSSVRLFCLLAVHATATLHWFLSCAPSISWLRNNVLLERTRNTDLAYHPKIVLDISWRKLCNGIWKKAQPKNSNWTSNKIF